MGPLSLIKAAAVTAQSVHQFANACYLAIHPLSALRCACCISGSNTLSPHSSLHDISSSTDAAAVVTHAPVVMSHLFIQHPYMRQAPLRVSRCMLRMCRLPPCMRRNCCCGASHSRRSTPNPEPAVRLHTPSGPQRLGCKMLLFPVFPTPEDETTSWKYSYLISYHSDMWRPYSCQLDVLLIIVDDGRLERHENDAGEHSDDNVLHKMCARWHWPTVQRRGLVPCPDKIKCALIRRPRRPKPGPQALSIP